MSKPAWLPVPALARIRPVRSCRAMLNLEVIDLTLPFGRRDHPTPSDPSLPVAPVGSAPPSLVKAVSNHITGHRRRVSDDARRVSS